jgi:heme/copper-type cytochrome/quinol oxidase subunit 2
VITLEMEAASMKKRQFSNLLILGALLVAGATAGFLMVHFHQPTPEDRYITITAHKYSYEPAVVRVNKGDRLHISLAASDVTHGFFLEGYDLDAQIPPADFNFRMRHPSESKEYTSTDEVLVVADHTGKFRYRCSNTCGYMHPFMQGELIVSPNYLFSTSVGMTLGLSVGMILVFRRNGLGGK